MKTRVPAFATSHGSRLSSAGALGLRHLVGLLLAVVLVCEGARADISPCIPDNLLGWCYRQHPSDTATPADVAQCELHLTSLSAEQARAVFYTTRQLITEFTATFTYRATNVRTFGCEYGATFCIQNSPSGACTVGGLGGGLGYAGVPNSVAVSLQLTSNSTGWYVGGAVGGSTSVAPVNLSSGHPINVTLTYSGGTLSETLVDTVTSDRWSRNIIIQPGIVSRVGGPLAYVGFTASTTHGACSGNAANQYISNFAFVAVCRADFNQSGTVTVQDIFDYLSAYFAGTPDADINQSGASSVQDVFDFLNAYFVGCP